MDKAANNRNWKAKGEQLRMGLEQTVNKLLADPFVKIGVTEIYQNGLIVGLDYRVEGSIRK